MTDQEMLPVEGTVSESELGPNFEFAFDNPNFSNKQLIVKIVPAGLPLKNDYELKPFPVEADIQESAGQSEAQTGEEVTLEMINACEQAAFINLLRFMYGMIPPKNMMSTRDFTDLLIAAQKFQASSCVKYCCESMRKSISLQSAPIYFCLPSITALEGVEEVQQLINECKRYAMNFWNKRRGDPIVWQYSLPLKGIEALLSSDELQVWSEDYIYDFVCTWAGLHYPKLEERKQFLRSRPDTLVRLRNLSCWKLKQILISDGILDSDHRKDLALNSLFHKVDDREYYRDRVRQRDYLLHPLKFLLFDSHTPGCVVYLDLKGTICTPVF
ncbi:hypothetical protein Tsubulata_043923 [Turnera subulata]|uniref:BACK domain-containing protein n=1 Tax=Turnera subulata TaxID=218843 RepID=A0A9Q0JD91_9ROSI|nr:hypothetical protein Tsubulata_043923 [Turnera subulata]